MSASIKPLNTEQVAAQIGIAPITLRMWRCSGKGPKFTKLGDSKKAGVVYFEADVQEWLAERKFTSMSAYSPHGRTTSKVHNLASSGAS